MNPVEEFLDLKKTAGLPRSLWQGMKFQPLVDEAGEALTNPAAVDSFGHVLGQQLTAGAAFGALTGGGSLAINGMRKLINMGIDKWKKPMEYKAMLDAHPELQQQDASKVQALYNSLRHMSPHMAKDPVIAGSFVRNLLERGNEGSVAVPMDTAKMLSETQRNIRQGRPDQTDLLSEGMSAAQVANKNGPMFTHVSRGSETEGKRKSNE